MSTNDLLSSTLNWPGKGLYGMKSSVLQTSETNLVKQNIVADHMRHHYRRLHNARSAVDTKPPKAMVLGQKCRDRARKELAQMAYTQKVIDEFSPGNTSAYTTPRGRSTQSARTRRFIQSQPTTFRARSRSIEAARMTTRSLNMNGSMQNLNQNNQGDVNMVDKLFGGGVLSQALTTMAALGKLTSSARNKSSADVLDKHPDSFSQPADEHQPRLVKREGNSFLRNNRSYYNPPSKVKARTPAPVPAAAPPVEPPPQEDALTLSNRRVREQLNRSLELRENVEKKIKNAKATTAANPIIKKQSDEALKRFGLTEQERLQYVRFMQDVTDAIVRKNLTTEPAIEKLFEIHIDRNKGTLDENRLRGLLEALKEDLGVQTSRKSDVYASVHKATAFDNNPLPPPVPAKEDPITLAPLSPYDDKRRPSYDLDAPLPWQRDNNDLTKQPATSIQHNTHESKRHSATVVYDPLNDDHLFSPPSLIKPKPRLSLQNKTEHEHQSDHPTTVPTPPADPESSFIPIGFNSTMRKPMTDLHNVNWLTNEQQPQSTSTTEKHALHVLDEHNADDNEKEDEFRSPSPLMNAHPESHNYTSDEFDESDNETGHQEKFD